MRLSYSRNLNGNAEVLEENNYYAFGLKHSAGMVPTANAAYNYQYNGKELQKETGWGDYGARMYMADIGRWGVTDPLAEQMRRYSPYNYAFNNPVSFIDPDGMAPKLHQFSMPGDSRPDAYSGGHNPNWLGLGNTGNLESGGYGGGNGYSVLSSLGSSNDYLLDNLIAGWTARGIDTKISKNGYLSYWTGGAAGYGSTSQEMVAHMLKLSESYIDNIDWHKTSQGFRSWSGNAYSVNEFILQPAADRAALYGAGKAFSTTNLVFEKTILGQRIYQPLLEISSIKAQRLAAGTKIAGRVLGGIGIGLAFIDINQKGPNTSNSLDLVMSVLAVSPTGWGQAIAGTYFLANFATQLVTGKDIGQHIEGAVNKYYNDGVRAEEQRKYNEAMGY
ncbi:RHS repeat-associated core domain-containing protein [Chryseobacterium lathyri]|uniref:RHS repeat-associated core domain-containing protein n=4 Tax=Chryseobacterium TaxID=59732 RepID=UPI000DD01661